MKQPCKDNEITRFLGGIQTPSFPKVFSNCAPPFRRCSIRTPYLLYPGSKSFSRRGALLDRSRPSDRLPAAPAHRSSPSCQPCTAAAPLSFPTLPSIFRCIVPTAHTACRFHPLLGKMSAGNAAGPRLLPPFSNWISRNARGHLARPEPVHARLWRFIPAIPYPRGCPQSGAESAARSILLAVYNGINASASGSLLTVQAAR